MRLIPGKTSDSTPGGNRPGLQNTHFPMSNAELYILRQGIMFFQSHDELNIDILFI